ncbi:hypothetical protein [Aeromonas sp. 604534]|uniref:hypothetical protein n=1 Tax=Aeromonas sp. 604534 TaxID=2712055 RepID=UPI0038EC3744
MTIETLTSEIESIDQRATALKAEAVKLADQVIELQRQALNDDAAAKALNAGRQRRALIRVELEDLAAARVAAERDLAAAQEVEGKSRAADLLPRVAELRDQFAAAHAELITAIEATAAAQDKMQALEAQGAQIAQEARQALCAGADVIPWRYSLPRNASVTPQMLQRFMVTRRKEELTTEPLALRAMSAIGQLGYAIADECGVKWEGAK